MTENDLTHREYRNGIKTICEVIESEYEDGDAIHDHVWQSVDSHEWVIYTNYNLQVLRLADNDPEEWKHMVSESDSWQSVIQTMAYKAMELDVYDELRKRDNIDL